MICVHFCTLAVERNRVSRVIAGDAVNGGVSTVLGRVYFARQASTLLRYARATNNPELAAALIEQAANLKARIDAVERPMPSPHAPDVETERE
jgi:hypothetical protein